MPTKTLMDLLSFSSKVSAADVSQWHEPYFIKVNQSIFEQEEIFVHSFLLKTHAEKLQFFIKEVRPFPMIIVTIRCKWGPSMYARPLQFSTLG